MTLHPRNSHRRASTSTRSKVLTLGSITTVVVVALVLTLISMTTSSASSGSPRTPAPAMVAANLGNIPGSVFDAVGVSSPAVALNPPTPIVGQPPLTVGTGSLQRPLMLYVGAEFCPFCAAERWVVATALDRFGTFTNLSVTRSSLADQDPGTPTLSFYGAHYTSPYLVFRSVELTTNRQGPNGSYQPLQQPTRSEQTLFNTYDTFGFVKSLGSSQANGSIPFVDLGNQVLVAGAAYSPTVLAGLTQTEIAQQLHDPTSVVARPIIASANYLSAGICVMTHGQPGSVCQSSGVEAAAASLGLPPGSAPAGSG